jgi:hypothetical protein
MTDQEKLKEAFEDVIWMAARYANGRSTYAPSMVRDAVKAFKEVYPEWEMRPDLMVMSEHQQSSKETFNLESDWLVDLYPTNENQK